MPRRLSPHRCPGCEIRRDLCFCSLIPRIELQTRVFILMHTREEVLPTNTARLAARVLTNCEIRINGRKDQPMPFDGLVEQGRQSLLLYPSSHALELSPSSAQTLRGPFNLIVPDGGWRHTQKFTRNEPRLAGIPHVKVPVTIPSQYRLRVQPYEKGVCTLEAIARAIGVLESPEAQSRLEYILQVMVERTLWSRGRISADNCVATSIPPEAFA